MKNAVLALGLTIFSFLFAQASQAEVRVSVTNSGKGDTHIVLKGLDQWRYDVSRKTEGGVQHVLVQLDGVTPDELQVLRGTSDARVHSIKVKSGLNGDALLDFTLTGPQVSFFDYQTDSPVNLVFDVYKESAAKVKKTVAHDAKKRGLTPHEQRLADLVEFTAKKRKNGRNVASVDAPEIGSQPLLAANDDKKLELKYGIFDGGDQTMSRFKIQPEEISEDAQIRSTNNMYVHFPELVFDQPYLQNILANGSKYEIETNDSDENLQVRFIIKLFNEKKFAVALRTLKFFYQKYPHNSYQKTLDFLTADIYLGLWQRDHSLADFEQAMALYKGLLEHYPDDPTRYRTLMLIGLNYLAAGNNMGTLATFQDGIKKYPDSPYYWQMRMAVADALNALDKEKDSLREYQSIEEDPQSKNYAIDARYRLGDVYFKAKDYETAAKEYREALKKYPDSWIRGPNLFFNQAESLFWTKDYKGSLDEYREFLQRFPNHPYGGYAMTRIGEILDILGASKKKVAGAYLESYFRYRGTPGAFLAKVHLNTERFAGMKAKEIETVLDEINDDMDGDVGQSGVTDIEPFVKLSLADGYTSRDDFKNSNDILIDYYQTNVLSPYLPYFKNRIVKNITGEMGQDNSKHDYVKALETFIKNSDSWFSKNQRIDTRFYAAQAYEALGVPDEAAKIYEGCLKSYYNLTPEQLKREQIFENLPAPDQINLRLASVSLKADDMKKAGGYLSSIKDPAKLSQGEQVERSLILSALAEKEERPDLALLALKDLSDHWNGDAVLLLKPWVRLGRINFDLKKYDDALPWVEKAMKTVKQDPGLVDHDVARAALDLAGSLYTQLGKNDAAIDAYKMYTDKFADNISVAAVRYKLGKLYYDKKDLRDASDVWAALKDDKNGELWAKMADEKLAEAQWNQKYDRYLDRQPAGGKP